MTHNNNNNNHNKPSLHNYYGDLIPFGDPNYYQGYYSHYYTSKHIEFRNALRDWVDNEIIPYVNEWDESYKTPKEIWKKAYDAGWLPGVIGSPWPTNYAGDNIIGGIKPEEYDVFMELILIDELSRCGSGGIMWGLCEGLTIGLPPVLQWGSEQLKQRVAVPCLKGDAIICLCVTEPTGGSDVANLQTTAILTDDKQHYIVNGRKKWITNGIWADFFTVAVRTGGNNSGSNGISFLLIERSFGGITTNHMKCSGVWGSGTTYIEFNNVKVPVSNLIGQENAGFKYIMYNFNHERWGLAIQSLRFARLCYEDSYAYSLKRSTFGKKLIEHSVIRLKLANMARMIESSWNMIENVTYQMSTMNKQQQNTYLSGSIALMKVQVTTTAEYCAREASQIFGGAAYTRTGQGQKVERLYREVRPYAIGGGSEEIMCDYAIRTADKQYKKLTQHRKQ